MCTFGWGEVRGPSSRCWAAGACRARRRGRRQSTATTAWRPSTQMWARERRARARPSTSASARPARGAT
eukprot:13786115-Alexandrium_andersonii.AAC.1